MSLKTLCHSIGVIDSIKKLCKSSQNVSRCTFMILGLLGIVYSMFLPSVVSANNWGLTGVSYTTRSGWGADESLTYANRPEYKKLLEQQFADNDDAEETVAETQRKTALDYLGAFFSQEIKIDRIFRKEGTKVLFWPIQYVRQKTKLIVHHTATNGKLPTTVEEEKKFMKDVYAYHALSNKWGDIGYNFVIMPSGRIYEGRKGGAGVIGAHVSWNNTKSVGVSLVGNFETIQPQQAQVDSLVTMLTALAKKYSIDPQEQKYYFKRSSKVPFIVAEKHEAIAGHRDAGYTKCPGENLYVLLGSIRTEVANRLAGNPSASIQIETNNSAQQHNNNQTEVIHPSDTITLGAIAALKKSYKEKTGFSDSKANITRLTTAPEVKNIPKLKDMLVRVLLYEASLRDTWKLTCDTSCVVRINNTVKRASEIVVAKNKTAFTVVFGGKKYVASKFAVSAGNDGSISITDYDRYASNKEPLNVFRQSLLFAYAPMKKIDEEPKNAHQIINIVSLQNYMKGIAEASDQETQTKANVLALLSKGYALFYMGGGAKHPSIPTDALYNAIDDPRLFQKYLGKGWENISKKRPIALEQTKDTYVTYNGVLPILPYFHCSAGFTRSAKEKRGWQDTPYLQSVQDSVACDDFAGHGVGLSGRGSALMAEQGKTEKEIIQYYYPGVEVEIIK